MHFHGIFWRTCLLSQFSGNTVLQKVCLFEKHAAVHYTNTYINHLANCIVQLVDTPENILSISLLRLMQFHPVVSRVLPSKLNYKYINQVS